MKTGELVLRDDPQRLHDHVHISRQVLVAGIPLGSLRRGGGKIGQAQQIDEIAVAGKSQLAHEADHRGGRYIALMGKRADAFILDGMDILHHILVDLDVYKRQGIDDQLPLLGSGQGNQLCNQLARKALPILKPLMVRGGGIGGKVDQTVVFFRRSPDGVFPVSYTHLDVYKRQDGNHAVA